MVMLMIFISKRKITIFIIFTVLFALSSIILHSETSKVFSGAISKRIILDSGHGLPDGGAVGANGTIESMINIKIAKETEKLLKKSGYTVIMTRTDEKTIADKGNTISEKKKSDMYRRLEIMNSSDADIFVSIHLNKFTDRRYRGAQVLYSGNFQQSELLASLIQKEFHKLSENESKRTHLKAPSGIFLLNRAQIPAVIAECGFLSNFEEEELLNKKEYQKKLAKAIVKGIEEYYERMNEDENIRN